MTVQRVSMHKIKEVLRLKYATGLKQRQIAALGLSHGVVAKYLSAAERAHLSYPWPAEWDDTHLAHALFGATYQPAPVKRLTLDFPYIHQELKRKGVTRQLLWDEYRAAHPEGYGYTLRWSSFSGHNTLAAYPLLFIVDVPFPLKLGGCFVPQT